MKKTLTLLLFALLLLSLAGCGGSKSAPAPTTAPTAAPTEAPKATEAPAVTQAPAVTEAPAATQEPDNAVEEMKALVLSMKGQPIAELIARIGEPIAPPEYASSCLIQGGQDGVFTYDGFTVYTIVKPDGTETVYDVE